MQLHVFPLCGRREHFTITFSSFSFIASASVASMSVGSQPRWELGNEVGWLLVWILFVIHRHVCSTTVYVLSENWNIQVPRAFNALTTDTKLDRYRVTIVNEIHNNCHKRFGQYLQSNDVIPILFPVPLEKFFKERSGFWKNLPMSSEIHFIFDDQCSRFSSDTASILKNGYLKSMNAQKGLLPTVINSSICTQTRLTESNLIKDRAKLFIAWWLPKVALGIKQSSSISFLEFSP